MIKIIFALPTPVVVSPVESILHSLDNSVSKKYFLSKTLSGVSEFLFYRYLTKDFFKYSDKTTMEVLSSLTSNKKLIGVLTGQWGDHGLPPSQSSFMMHAMIVHHYLDGGNYPVGGCRKIAEVPVETMVADIFWATNPDLPIPVTTILPWHSSIRSTVSS